MNPRPACLHCLLMLTVQTWPEPFEDRISKLLECIADLIENGRRQGGDEAAEELIAHLNDELDWFVSHIRGRTYKRDAKRSFPPQSKRLS